MNRLIGLGLVVMTIAAGEPSAPDSATAAAAAAAKRAFVDVARVLQSPRCMNCHPASDAPLQTDQSRPHAMNVTRTSAESGLACATCHRERNSEALGIAGGPPGAPKWGLPPKATPMVFEKVSLGALCEQLKDPARNGHKDFAALFEHVDKDPLVLWGWAPGGKRTLPPLSHREFVTAWKTWSDANGPCP